MSNSGTGEIGELDVGKSISPIDIGDEADDTNTSVNDCMHITDDSQAVDEYGVLATGNISLAQLIYSTSTGIDGSN
jgi:hypothetical protein